MNIKVAKYFAFESIEAISGNNEFRTVLSKMVDKSEIVAYFDGRDEEEVIWIPELK